MTARVIVLVGTRRGAFFLESDEQRRTWKIRGPLANPGWAFGPICYDPATHTVYAAGNNAWYGPTVWWSRDLGETWSLSSEGITYGDAGPSVLQSWALTAAHGRVYAGVDPAGLFTSTDGGTNWAEVGTPLRAHPTASTWRPGKGGLPVHSIVPHPMDPQQLWVALAGGGVLHTADGGRSWAPRNPVTADGQPALRAQKLAMAAGRQGLLYQQNHLGVFRSADGGQSWADITGDLPTRFGFPLAVHPREPGTLYVMPHRNDHTGRHFPNDRLAVWRSRDGGDTWTRHSRGLPDEDTYAIVLRDGLATDSLDPAGLYFGTSSGHVFASFDEGETWQTLAPHLPEILSVSAVVIHR